jgi:Tfp pilus assembly PilM family ATPase
MGRAVGIELTESAARILCLEQDGRQAKIVQFHEALIPSDPAIPWEVRASATLKQALQDARAPRGRVVCSLDSGDAILREVTLPFKNEDQLRKTVRFEMESLIHNFTIEQLIVAHYKTGETDKGSHLLAAAVPKTVIARRLDLYRQAGVDPSALDLDICAVFSAMLYAGAIDSDQPHLLVYGTSKFTKLVLIEQRRPRSIRTIRFSMSGAPHEAAAPPGPADPGEGLPGPEEAIVVLSEDQSRQFSELDRDEQHMLVEILSKEISRFLLAGSAAEGPTHILLSGAFEDRAAAELLQAATEIPVRTFDLARALGADPSIRDRSPAMAAALGLALKGVGIDPLGMDFRQEEFQYRKKFEAIKNTLFVTAQLLIVALLAVALHFYLRKADAERDRKSVQNHAQALFENVTGKTLTDAESAFRSLRQEAALYGPVGADLPLRATAREAWRELFSILEGFQRRYGGQKMGDADLLLLMETIEIQQNTTPGTENLMMTFRGKIRNLEFAGALRGELRAKELFRNAEWIGPIITGEDGLCQFQLRSISAKGK